jgi:hypothetical protein
MTKKSQYVSKIEKINNFLTLFRRTLKNVEKRSKNMESNEKETSYDEKGLNGWKFRKMKNFWIFFRKK